MYHRAICNWFECNVTHRRRLKLLAATLALSSFFHASVSFAAEDSSAETTKNANESILNWLESEDYLITAERIPSNRWDTPASVYIITAQEIEDNHYQTLEEALSHINGVVIEDPGINASTARVNEGYRVLLLVDGHRVNTSQGINPLDEKSNVKWFPSIKIIERIEIVKGGASALYGTDAVDGVINIITKKGTRNETTVDLNTGTWHRHNYEITNQGVKDKFSWFASGGIHKSHPFGYKNENVTRPLDSVTDYDDKAFFIRLDNTFDKNNSITFDVMHRDSQFTPYEDYGNVNTNFLLSYNFKESTALPGWLRFFDMRYSEHRNAVSTSDTRMKGIEYQNGWSYGRHQFIVGAEWHQNRALLDRADYPSTVKHNVYDRKLNNLAAYVQDKISLGDKWKVIAGARLDHTKEFGTNKSPKIAVNYRADNKTKFYASWGRSYRLPSIGENYELESALIAGTYNYEYIFGGYYANQLYPDIFAALTSEKGHTEAVGIEHDFDDNIGIKISLFNSSISNSIRQLYIPDPDGNWATYIYNDWEYNEKHRGVTLDFHQKIGDHFNYNVGYTHSNSAYASTQPNSWRVGLHYNNRGLKINLLGIMAHGLYTGTVDTDIYGMAGFYSSKQTVFDFNCSYDLAEQITLYARATNFTNQNFNGKGRAANLPGRAFLFGVTCRF